MPFWVYILKSQTTGRFYCGQTSRLEQRLNEHNDTSYNASKTTKRFKGPWNLIWKIECQDRGQAMKLERTVKKRGINRFLRERTFESWL